MKVIVDYDARILIWLLHRRYSSNIASVAFWVSIIGDGYLYWLVGLCLIHFDSVNGLAFFNTCLMAFAIELPLYLFIKNTIKRYRPFDTLSNVNSYKKPADVFSFPSGHSAGAFLFASVVSAFYIEFSALAYCVAVLISLSRLFLGVHFPTDLLAGALLGMVCAQVVLM